MFKFLKLNIILLALNILVLFLIFFFIHLMYEVKKEYELRKLELVIPKYDALTKHNIHN